MSAFGRGAGAGFSNDEAIPGLTASRIVLTDSGTKLASNAALTTNVLVKSASSGASLEASNLSDSGSVITAAVSLLGSNMYVQATGGNGFYALGPSAEVGGIGYGTEQTPDTALLMTGSLSNAWVMCELADRAFDFAHAQQTDPTLFIHSHNQSTTQWLGLTHDGTNGVITVGTGSVSLRGSNTLLAHTVIGDGSLLGFGTNFDGTANVISRQTEGTPDQTGLWTGTTSNAWLIAEAQDKAFDFAHAQQTNPTLFIHSAAQSTTQWLGLSHNGTNGVLDVGTGSISFNTSATPRMIVGSSIQTLMQIDVNSGANTLGENFRDNVFMGFGSSSGDAIMRLSTAQTPDSLVLGVGALSNALIIAESADLGYPGGAGFDFAHAQQTNPTLFIHSAAQSTTQWLGLTHDGTNGVITVGAGELTTTNVFRVPNGTVAAVGLRFAAHAGTGIFTDSSNKVAIAAEGTALINFVSNGSININSNWLLGWSSSSPMTAGSDVAILRVGAGNLKITDASTGAGALCYKRVVEANTGTKAPGVQESNEVYTNEGDTDGSTINLPGAVAGLVYTVVVQAAQTITVNAAAGDTIRIAASVSSAGGSASASTVGNTLTLIAINATEWVSIAREGTWTLA